MENVPDMSEVSQWLQDAFDIPEDAILVDVGHWSEGIELRHNVTVTTWAIPEDEIAKELRRMKLDRYKR